MESGPKNPSNRQGFQLHPPLSPVVQGGGGLSVAQNAQEQGERNVGKHCSNCDLWGLRMHPIHSINVSINTLPWHKHIKDGPLHYQIRTVISHFCPWGNNWFCSTHQYNFFGTGLCSQWRQKNSFQKNSPTYAHVK